MNNEKRETVADIVKELRRQSDNDSALAIKLRRIDDDVAFAQAYFYAEDAKYLSKIADRIDAAWKRERSKVEADALSVGGIVEAARHKPIGNAAAMREALVQCELFLGNVSRHGHQTLNPGDKCTACDGVDELRGLVVRALAAPARNGDKFSDAKTARQAWLDDKENWCEFGSPTLDLYEWFFAHAAERKGAVK